MRHGSQLDPPNRFDRVHTVLDLEHVEWDDEYLRERDDRRVEYLPDASQSIISENDSPDIPYRYSLNPYRGCTHGCAYCYARNTHEYLGLNAGLDFETKILVKHEAPRLLREFLARPSWRPEPLMFCGVTDCYQPAERQFRLTRGCLEVLWECRQPVGLITKNALVVRDLDVLSEMACHGLVHVAISITTLDVELARTMEPRTSIPAARLRAIRMLSEAGVPVRAMTAPIIPGLNDREIPALLEAVKEAGAQDVGYVLLRLPITVEPVFREWLRRTHPLQAERIEGLIQRTRRGAMSSARFGERMKGHGRIAEQIRAMFQVFRDKLGFGGLPPLDCERFQPPQSPNGQMRLF
jgi:DNA repair photolyase